MTSNKDQFSADMMTEDETLTPFDVRDSSGRQGLIKLIIGTVVLLAIAFLLLKFYQPGTRDRDAPPLITAENTPFKVTPEDQEGLQAPDQDRGVFDVMNGQPPKETVTDTQSPEVPITLPKNQPAQNPPSGANIQLEPPSNASETSSNEKETQAETPVVSEPAPVASQPRTGGSEFVVQVASVRSEADAQKVWNDLEQRFASLLPSGVYVDIKRVNLDEKGIYYRTRVAGLADKSAANSLCNSFKGSGQACFVTTK
tara:strand:- start:1 stop:768 length:768 start_codon:yes stop_codon:yes gene_type:complete